MSRVHEEDVTETGLSVIQFRFQFGVEKLGKVPNVLVQLFLGGTGIARMRCHFNPMSLRNLRTWVGPRRRPVSFSIRSHASAIVQAGCSSNDARMMSRNAANSLTGLWTF